MQITKIFKLFCFYYKKKMQLLFEEFFKKVYGYSKGNTNSLMLILTIRLMIYGFIVGFIVLVGYLIYTGRFKILAVVVGLVVVGEVSHFVRISREKSAHKRAPKDASMEHAAEVLKAGKSKNKKLLKVSKDKNKGMLKSSKVKNKGMLTKNRKGLLNKRKLVR